MNYSAIRDRSEYHWEWFAKLIVDLVACAAAIVISYLLRFSLNGALERLTSDIPILFLIVGLQVGGFTILGLYSDMWRYTGLRALSGLGLVAAASLSTAVIVTYALSIPGLPRSIVALDGFNVVFLCGGIRLTARQLFMYQSVRGRSKKPDQRVLIYGAGNAGELMLRTIEQAADINIHVVGFVDDEPAKQGLTIHGRRVLGTGQDLGALVHRHEVSDVYVAMPSLSGRAFRGVLENIRNQTSNRVNVRTLPGVNQLANGLVSINQIRRVEISDLLRREPVSLDPQPVARLLRQRTCMVVGGGGSIGSELNKQIAGFSPEHLVVVDNCEFNIYRLEAELLSNYPRVPITCRVADGSHSAMMRRIFAEYRPDFVFHAAAYKHVPLMEENPWAAVINNLRCTLTLAELSESFGVKRFILISSDKAVRPSSVMGASKRICELIISAHNHAGTTSFTAVRFGNVLGSSGSVIPKFADQIAQGGPVTVTHPDITRYFMLIPEAVELVLQVAAISERGQTFVLNMGEPIRITELAESMIKLACTEQNREIEIVYTGLRPGEKLHEVLYFEGDETATHIPNLLVLQPKQEIEREYVIRVHEFLQRACDMDKTELLLAIRQLAPEYSPSLHIHATDRTPQPQPVSRHLERISDLKASAS